MADEVYETTEAFVQKMDAGGPDFDFFIEMRKLSTEQLARLADILTERTSSQKVFRPVASQPSDSGGKDPA